MKIKLAKPMFGWSALLLEEHKLNLSCIYDIPFMLCNMIEDYLSYDVASCTFDNEQYLFTLVLNCFSVDVIEFKDNQTKLLHAEVDGDYFCKYIVEDLYDNIDEWSHSIYWLEDNQIDSYAFSLKEKLDEIKELLSTRQKGCLIY